MWKVWTSIDDFIQLSTQKAGFHSISYVHKLLNEFPEDQSLGNAFSCPKTVHSPYSNPWDRYEIKLT